MLHYDHLFNAYKFEEGRLLLTSGCSVYMTGLKTKVNVCHVNTCINIMFFAFLYFCPIQKMVVWGLDPNLKIVENQTL